MRQISTILFCLLISGGLLGQDIHFSHFYSSPLHINAAQTGFFDGTYRLGGNFKSQWKSITVPYQTFSAWGDYKLQLGRRSDLALGAIFINDESGDGNLTARKILLQAALQKRFKKLYFGIGIGGGYVQKNLDFDKLYFDSQWTLSGFSRFLPTNEGLTGIQSLNYFDVKTGVIGGYRFNDDLDLYVGAALAHAFSPQETYYEMENFLGKRPVIHGGGFIKTSEYLHFEPYFVYMNQKKAFEYLAGSLAGYRLEYAELTVLSGAFMRGSRDVVPVAGADYKDFRFLISYDVNISSLQPATDSRGGIEFSLIYTGGPEEDRWGMVVPCFRF